MFRKKWKYIPISFIIGFFIGCVSFAKEEKIKIAVIDSGFNYKKYPNIKLCKKGHFDFIEGKFEVATDNMDHGDNVINIINKYANSDKHCFIVLKVFDFKSVKFNDGLTPALIYANSLDVDIVNISVDSSKDFSLKEREAFINLAKRSKIFISAGNSGINLDKYKMFPVSYQDIDWFIIGANNKHSNYGSIVTHKEDFCQDKFCGTSASVAIATGKYIHTLMLK